MVGRVVEVDEFMRRCASREFLLEPLPLNGVIGGAVWLLGVAVNGEEMYQTNNDIVVALIPGKGKVVEVGR
jgi:hypothetical protein